MDKTETPGHKKQKKPETTFIKETHSSVLKPGCPDSVPTNLEGIPNLANNHNNLLTTINPNPLGLTYELGSSFNPYLQ